MSDDHNRLDIVLEGGGVKGIGLVGALEVLEEKGYVFQNIAGTSAGAITATLLAAGYRPRDLRELLFGLDFESFQDWTALARIPLAGPPLSVLLHHGLCKGDRFLSWMTELLEDKKKRTFGDMVHPDFADRKPVYRYRAQVVASDVSCRNLLLLPRDARELGVEPDELEIAAAVRMSMSIPLFFEPVRVAQERSRDGGAKEEEPTHVIVDGGLLSNFPVWIFDSGGEPEWPTFGLMLAEDQPGASLAERLPPPARIRRGPAGLVEYGRRIVQTMLEANDRRYLTDDQFARTIPIPTLGVRTTEFNLAPERAQALYESGRDAATKFLAKWDFEQYKAQFRAKEPPSRRERIVEEMRGSAGPARPPADPAPAR